MQRLLRVSVAVVIGDNSLLIFAHSKYSRPLNVQMVSENMFCSLRACYQSESLLAGIFRPCKFIKMSFNKVTINPLCCLYPASWRPVNDNAPSEMIRKRWMLTQTHTLEPLSVPVGQCDWGLSQNHFIPLVYGTIMIVVEKTDLTMKILQQNCRTVCFCWVLNWILWFDLTIDLNIHLNIKKRKDQFFHSSPA